MISLLLIIAAAIFFPGIIIRTKSISAGRKGPGLFQPWRDVAVLLQKGSVISTSTSAIFKLAPVVSLASVITVMLLLPFPGSFSVISFDGDFILFAYLLAFGKFWTIIGALDTASSFQGMGANREALFSMLIEPVFFILIGTLCMINGVTSFSVLFNEIENVTQYYYLVAGIGIYLFFQIALIENSRLPVDDPKTHLELTMIHEVMVLDNSGFDMALIHIAGALKFGIFSLLISNLLIPDDWTFVTRLSIFAGVVTVFAGIVGLLESFRVRYQMKKNPIFIFSLTSIALICFMLVLILTKKIV